MMYKNKVTTILILRLLMLFLWVAATFELVEDARRMVHVIVLNKLPPGQNFTVHCKSKDDDLGVHELGPQQAYTFHFHGNIFGTTLFFCGINTDYGNGVYDIYDRRRDRDRCFICIWDVKQDGVYGYREGSNSSDIFLKWVKT
ncbi:hypothetical protein SAY87_006556 [Trapa incisa]|uniref:S-protein homolog n=2 Tax=Trapa TaxID=22665 RepID=A0AAN7L1H9_TRANT|nr:hypothetical protein SAY87_006556 [Trapa incisa]KAK4774413.1 hypothetical protein SAY86_009348 [Trapa natans]